MIDVKVRKNRILITGHANYSPHGQDIVCSAMTVLAMTLYKSINDLTEDKIDCKIEAGLVDIKFKDLSEKAKTLIDSFFVGSACLANEFPDHIRIT